MTIEVQENKSHTIQTGGKLSTSSSNSSITVVENETEKVEELSSSKTSYLAEGKIDKFYIKNLFCYNIYFFFSNNDVQVVSCFGHE